MRPIIAVGLATFALLLSSPALAYRPFDGTDAAVGDPYEIEVELGPVGYLREGRARYLVAPALVANYGLAPRWELVAEGKAIFPVSDAPDEDPSLGDPAIAIKTVLREGGLQGGEGPSIATEVAVLLPTPDEHGVGGSALLVVSQAWAAATAHLNLEVAYEREHRPAGFLGLILEGPDPWPARPVAEVFVERSDVTDLSALVGMIWPVADRLSFDFAARLAHADSLVGELRGGMTFSISILRHEPPAQRLGTAPHLSRNTW